MRFACFVFYNEKDMCDIRDVLQSIMGMCFVFWLVFCLNVPDRRFSFFVLIFANKAVCLGFEYGMVQYHSTIHHTPILCMKHAYIPGNSVPATAWLPRGQKWNLDKNGTWPPLLFFA